MTTEELRVAIETALRRRDPEASVRSYPSTADRGGFCACVWLMHTELIFVGTTETEAMQRAALVFDIRDDGSDPAEEVERLHVELAETERRLNAEISAMDARDGAYQALDGARDGSDELVALAECRMAEIRRLRAELALERERCAGLVREIPACQPGAKATAARRWLDDRVAACVRAIEVDDETATCARASVREARERAKAAEADVARLEFALQCEATRHEETRAAVRGYLAAEAACDDARTALGEMSLIHDTPDAIRAADEAVAASSLRLISARKALRKIVEGE
jgi:hypothetical protein